MDTMKLLTGFRKFFPLLFLLLIISCRKNSGPESKISGLEPSFNYDTVKFNDWPEIKASGRLTAILRNSPTGYFLYKGRPMGFEYELLNRFCEQRNIALDIILESDIEKCFAMLQEGKCDIVAHSLTITKERRKNMEFTMPQYTVRHMLVQRLPDNYRTMKLHEIENFLIRDPIDLIGKEIHVRKNASYVQRLKNLSGEIGGDIHITEEFGDILTEDLIGMVARKEINYTVADEDIANITATYYSNLDVKTPLSFPTQIGWAVRKNSPALLNELNTWIRVIKLLPDYNVIYKRYFNDPKGYLHRLSSDFSSIGGNRISPYDPLIKKYAKKIGWDWKLLAAMIYHESRFNPKAESWAGAMGLMQVIPETGELYGTKNILDAEQNIRAGSEHLLVLTKFWKARIGDNADLIKYILASYNVGQGHVEDAMRLTEKYKRDPRKWNDNVEYFLLKKSEPYYYEDDVSQSGYCRGEEPVEYVKEILNGYSIYSQLVSD
ncbi:MAG TPA: transporter substrate-binding domain-containing protein [Cyclobacteriaceae bacterium]|nr:transporter substrate-binding domain-containing protein [Cyclobacteriaceae bacterium]